MVKQNLVKTWLAAIGLSPQIVETFEAAGIVHPKDLAELEVCHYPALGVTDSADRKKLFYLVQRVKLAVPDDEKNDNNDDDNYLQRAGEPTSVDETPDEPEDQYTDSFEIDTGDDDGIDEVLQEQYKPLLHDSDDDSFQSSDDFTSDEDVPSPPITPTRHDQSLNTSHTSSPQYEREAAFLKGRNARMEKLTPPRKSNAAIPKLQKSLKDTPERYKKATKRSGVVKTAMKFMRSKGSDCEEDSSESPKRTTLFVKKKKSPRKSTAPSSRRERLDRIRNAKSSDNDSESPVKHRSPTKTLDMGSIVVPEALEVIAEPPATRRSKRVESKLARDLEPPKSVSNSSTSPSTETDGGESPASQKSWSSGVRNRRSAAETNLSLTRSNSGDNGINHSDSFEITKSKKASLGLSGKSTAKERRSKLQNPTTRENTRLSTIPSDRPSIISPFRTSSTSVDEIFGDDVDVASVSTSNSSSRIARARTSSVGDRSVRSTSSRMSIKSSKSYKKEKSDKEDLASRAKSTPRGRMSIAPRNNSPDSPAANSLKSKSFENFEKKDSGTPKSTKLGGSSGAVFVHRGGKTNKSWSSRVAILRDAHTHTHEEETGGRQDEHYNEEEMRIRVVVRKRPMSRKEASKKDEVDVIHPLRYADYGRVLVYQPKTRVDLKKEVETLPFAFDNVFAEESNNCQIYNETIKPLIPGAFEGRWASVFAYGQTGSGKTFTMMGSTLTGIKAKNRSVEHEKNYGLYVLAARDLFEFASRREYSHLSVGASLFEIYGGKLFDLLNDRAPVKCLENHKGRVCFPGLSEHPITDVEQLMGLIEHGSTNRSTGSTSANRDSSRSHAVLQLHLRKTVGRNANVEHGRLTFIDLAGSERGADTNKASRITRLEGADINTSLLALKEVIRALATGDSMTHIPFRGSKLTQVLKESFVGKSSRTVMVACVAPNMTNCDHTVNTLRYADRVKERNPETGRLADSIAAASNIQTKHRPISFPNRTNDEANENADADDPPDSDDADADTDTDENWLSDLDDDSSDNDDCENYDEGIDELNEVLRSPVATRLDGDNFFGKYDHGDSTDKTQSMTKKEAVAPLVSTHRSIMTEMLGMVKQEMTLVNCTDADRELIDDYLDELEAIQDQQLAMISTLRDSLVHYYAHRPAGGTEENIPSDDSFDDLRSPQR